MEIGGEGGESSQCGQYSLKCAEPLLSVPRSPSLPCSLSSSVASLLSSGGGQAFTILLHLCSGGRL
jgi:hypothetical protein